MRFPLLSCRDGKVSGKAIEFILYECLYISHICSILSETGDCPMCGEHVAPEQLLDVEDIRPYSLAAT